MPAILGALGILVVIAGISLTTRLRLHRVAMAPAPASSPAPAPLSTQALRENEQRDLQRQKSYESAEVRPPAAPAPRPVVTLLLSNLPANAGVAPSSPPRTQASPLKEGQVVPSELVDGGLRPVNLLAPPTASAPAGAYVILAIRIDRKGNVYPTQCLSGDNGLCRQAMAAAKAWKFQPPTVNGKPVSTSVSVRVAF